MRVLITGSKGFIGKNLKFFLLNQNFKVFEFNRNNKITLLNKLIENVDIIFHLGGENRSNKKNNFIQNNFGLTKKIVDIIIKSKKKPSIIFSSSIKVNENNLYGLTKKKAENYISKNLIKNSINYSILRLPNIFGKWSKPNHNSFVATCCYNLPRNKKIQLNKNVKIKLFYIDDLINIFSKELNKCLKKKPYNKIVLIKKSYEIKLFDLVNLIKNFNTNYNSINNNQFKNSFQKKLFSTFISYLPYKKTKFLISTNLDHRGRFVEFSRRDNFGQVSYFTVQPGVTRGEHYHNTKIEKFLVISGSLTYVTRSLLSNKKKIYLLNSKKSEIIYSIPGHVHFFKNKTSKEAIVMVWANEVFDKKHPDTYN